MAARVKQSSGKFWYTIQVDTLRLWIGLAVVAVLALAGYFGWSRLETHLLSRQIEGALQEGRDLVQELRTEAEILSFRSEFSTGRQSLEEASRLLVEGELKDAWTSAERGRSLLRSILDTLRHDGPSGEAQFIAVQGGVEYRRGERGEWLPARSRVMLFPGDYVKTSGGGSAEVMTVEGTLFTVRPDTVILIDRRSDRAGAPGERTIALQGGWVNLSTSHAASRVKTPQAEAVVAQRSDASVSYDQEQKAARFTAVRGGMEVTSSDGRTRSLGDRQQLDQLGARMLEPKSLPPAPITLGPSDNLEVFRSEEKQLVIEWEPVRGAVSYALQVSQNRLFVDNVIDVDARTKTRATVGLQGEGSFIWRVAANDREGARGPWSLARRFRVSAERGAVDVSLLLRPAAAERDAAGSDR